MVVVCRSGECILFRPIVSLCVPGAQFCTGHGSVLKIRDTQREKERERVLGYHVVGLAVVSKAIAGTKTAERDTNPQRTCSA